MFTHANNISPKYDFQSDAQADITIVRVVVVERATSVHIALVVRVAGIRRLTECNLYYMVDYSIKLYFNRAYLFSSETIHPVSVSPIE